MHKFEEMEQFLSSLQGDVYPEIPGEPHLSITRQMIGRLVSQQELKPGKKVLDVGCGQGLALSRFKKLGVKVVGIALGEDVAICRKQGFDVREMDQSFLKFNSHEFDLIWCRHALEHSIFPFFTLAGFKRILKPGGLLYVEVPAPDTCCHHEQNPNHYSVLGKSMWNSLFIRIGFILEEDLEINFDVPAGSDTYWAFFLRQPSLEKN